MESTGLRGKIQISQETADLLISAGKHEWLTLREEKVVAKGKVRWTETLRDVVATARPFRSCVSNTITPPQCLFSSVQGEMQTYWLALGENRSDTASNMNSSNHGGSDDEHTGADDDQGDDTATAVAVAAKQEKSDYFASESKTARLIEWNLDVLLRLLKQIVARRKACGLPPYGTTDVESHVTFADEGNTTIDEVAEIITLPKFNAKAAVKQEDPDSIQLPRQVVDQLYDYVSNIAAIYNENPFHNFEHASHGTFPSKLVFVYFLQTLLNRTF